MNDINKFYKSFLQDINALQISNDEGDTQEQVFTRSVVDMLCDAGESENVTIAFDEKDLGTKNQHKINAFAISDNKETVDLFISIYNPEEDIQTITRDEIKRATTRVTNFFRKSIYDNYAEEVAPSSQIFDCADILGKDKDLKDNLIRVNSFILTNGSYKGDNPSKEQISGYSIYYKVVDINYIYRISEDSRTAIEIDFSEGEYQIPCLASTEENEKYQAYIAIVPGQCLADIYEKYGARLLEQNVRAFLQFTGKINKGIRDTIKNEPKMFLAYNNGIAATADNIELDESKRFIKKVSNLQIVNGGQTTASIYHTMKKDKADLKDIYVQVKFSIIKEKENFSEIVSLISKFTNTQNKVNDADFTANNPKLVELEKFSRFIMTPLTQNSNIQTYWYFERARGQYKNLRQKEGFTKAKQKSFDLKYPKDQMFNKVLLAKYVNAYQEVWDGKKLKIGPHLVVKGNEQNYAKFISDNMPDKIDSVYFEDCIAKAILFKAADKRYGTQRNDYCIGQMKQAVVPYTLAYLNIITENRLDVYKIWKNQRVSDKLSDFLYDLMKQMDQYIQEESPSTRYTEWAKKEDCWLQIREHKFAYNLDDITGDLIDPKHPPVRKSVSIEVTEDEKIKKDMEIINSIPYQLWAKFAEWGAETGLLTFNQQVCAKEIAHKLRFKHSLASNERHRGIEIFEIVCKENIDMLDAADDFLVNDNGKSTSLTNNPSGTIEITKELVEKMVAWDKYKHVLIDWKWKIMNEVAIGKRPLTDQLKKGFYINYKQLKQQGFGE